MLSMKRLAAGAGLSALALALSTAAFAQETTSAIHGTITSGATPVAGASVTLVHTPSGTRQTTMTNAAGVFDSSGLRVGGPYTITVTGGGQSKTFNDIYLDLGKTFDFNGDLTANQVQAVTVTASTGAKSSEQGPKTVMNRDAIQSVVSVNRDIRDIARRDILVSQDLSGGRAGTNGGGISIAGSNPRFNRIAVDGVSAQDNFGLAQGGLTTSRGPVTLDAVEQFVVSVAPVDVENGDFTGGALNLVLRSGGNQFHGSIFDNYLNEGLVGKHIGALRVPQVITQKNWGYFLSGPIIPDKLFFATSYETYQTTDPTLYGAIGQGLANNVTNLTQAQIDAVVADFATYATKFTPGGIPNTAPVTDKKYTAKFDWNISDNHRATLSFRQAQSTSYQRTDAGLFTASLYSHWYQQLNQDTATTLEVHSRWSDALQTTLRATYRDYRNGQNPPGGQNFADISVCDAQTPDSAFTSCASGVSAVRFGPDQFRHANALDEQESRFVAQGEYTVGSNLFKFGAQARKAVVYDIFLPQSHGLYYFDTEADFKSGTVDTLTYQDAVNGNKNSAAFDAEYWTDSLYFQDALNITDNLKATGGVRYDWYDVPSKPILNPNFQARNGFSNQMTIDGLHIVQPRFALEWKPAPEISLNAGFGLFGGGTPDVLTGTAFYNTGYATSSVTFQRCSSGATCFSGYQETTGNPGYNATTAPTIVAALNSAKTDPNFGYVIPSAIRALVIGGTPAPLGEVIAMSPSFQMPGQYKAYLSGTAKWAGFNFQLDLVATRAKDEITYYDSRAQLLVVNGVQQFLPDGRLRYDGLGAVAGKSSTNLGSNRDIIISNANKGDSYSIGMSVARSFDWGGDFSIGYAKLHSNDLGPGLVFGTTAGSLYASVPSLMDPNRDYVGRSVNEIANHWKFGLGYRHKWFGAAETRVTLFGERQSGRPFGFAESDATSGRSQVFGVNRTAQAIYVPDMSNYVAGQLDYGLVHFATANDAALFKGYVDRFGLKPGLLSKYSNTNKDISQLSVQLSQDVPAPVIGKFKVVFDIRNVLNLLNRNWGKVSEYSDVTTLNRVSCWDPATKAVVPLTSAACPAYQYSSVSSSVTRTQNTPLSLWYMQIGLRYEF